MGLFTSLLGGGIKDISTGASNILDKLVTTEAEKQTIKLEFEKEINRVKESLEEKANEVEKAYLADIQSAREMNARIQESTSASWLSKNITPILTLVLTAGFFGMVFFLTQYQIPEENKEVIYTLAGSLGTAWIATVTYYFGSSKGSADKDLSIRNLMKSK